jgi:hypothetical protein
VVRQLVDDPSVVVQSAGHGGMAASPASVPADFSHSLMRCWATESERSGVTSETLKNVPEKRNQDSDLGMNAKKAR